MIYDAVVLGAGLYGCKVALELRALRLRVALIDPNPVMSQATRVNQNRIHAGFHYPRAIATAETAARHYERFLIDHASAVAGNKRHLYCIASDSKVGPEKYEEVLEGIGAEFRGVWTPEYFAPGVIAQCYETHEKSFHIDKLRALLMQQLKVAGVEVIRPTSYDGGHACPQILSVEDDHVVVRVLACYTFDISARYVFNCTYANIDKVIPIRTKLVKEHVEVPFIQFMGGGGPFQREDVTIMDGQYFSMMRYPPEPYYALTHVKHGRHHVWSPSEPEPEWNRATKVSEMLLDAARYIPMMAQAYHLSSMFTTRVLLAENSDDDGRPVLIEYSEMSPRIISILGSKFNSVYEVTDFLRRGEWAQSR